MSNDRRDDENEPRSYSLNDLFAIIERQRTQPWPASEALQAVEEGYRRGYLNGWQHAVDAIFRLMQERGFTPMQAALSADAHHAGALHRWRIAAHPDVLGDPLTASTFNGPRDYPPAFPWQSVRNPEELREDEDEDEREAGE